MSSFEALGGFAEVEDGKGRFGAELDDEEKRSFAARFTGVIEVFDRFGKGSCRGFG